MCKIDDLTTSDLLLLKRCVALMCDNLDDFADHGCETAREMRDALRERKQCNRLMDKIDDEINRH